MLAACLRDGFVGTFHPLIIDDQTSITRSATDFREL
jgi:hypothetical protein